MHYFYDTFKVLLCHFGAWQPQSSFTFIMLSVNYIMTKKVKFKFVLVKLGEQMMTFKKKKIAEMVLHSVKNFPVHFGKTSCDEKSLMRNFYKRSFCSVASKTSFESFILGNSLSTVWPQMIHRHNGICFCFTVLHIKWSHQDTMDCALWPKTNPQSFTFCHP